MIGEQFVGFLLMLGPFEILDEHIITALLSGILGFAGLLLHNLVKAWTDGVDFVVTLPRIENGKLRISGATINVIFAVLVGAVLMDPIAAFFVGYGGANAIKDVMLLIERRGLLATSDDDSA